MHMELSITPSGHLLLQDGSADGGTSPPAAVSKTTVAAFGESTSRGLLHLATSELQTSLPASLDFARQFARTYLTRLCHTPAEEGPSRTQGVPHAEERSAAHGAVPPPTSGELATLVLRAPPMRGLEYLNADALTAWWHDLDALVRD